MSFFTTQHRSKKAQNSRSWLKQIFHFLSGLATIFCLLILFCGVAPSPFTGIFQTPSPNTKHHSRLMQATALDNTTNHNLDATIAIHLIYYEGKLELILPAFTIVQAIQEETLGTFSINWPQIFGYSMHRVQPLALPSLWDYAPYPFEEIIRHTSRQHNPSFLAHPPFQQSLEQRIMLNDSTWCTLSLLPQRNIELEEHENAQYTVNKQKLIGKHLAALLPFIREDGALLAVDILKDTPNIFARSVEEYTLYVTNAEYIDLSTYVYNTLLKDNSGQFLIPTPAHIDGIKKLFQTNTHYSFVQNNTTWLGSMLKIIHAPTSLWTNLPYFIRWHLPNLIPTPQTTPTSS